MNYFSIWLWHVMKSGFYITTSDGQLSGWAEKKLQSISQSQTCTKKRSWSLFGGLLPVWSLQPFKSRQNHYNWEVCSAYCWGALKTVTPTAGIVHQKEPQSSLTMPNCLSYNQHFKSWMNWATKICFTHHIHLTSHQPTTTSSSISKTFCRENASTIIKRQKMLSKSLSKPKPQFSHTGRNKLISCWQKCFNGNGSYFD